MSALTISLSVFVCIFGGGLLGILIHHLLPDDQLRADSKDVVRLGMGLVATTAALVLGLLVASAKAFYDTQNTEVTQFAANMVLLDRVLAHYGAESAEARAALPNAVTHMIEVIEPYSGSNKTHSQHGSLRAEVLIEKIQELSPKDDNQRSLRQQASNVAVQLGQIRWLMYEPNKVPFPMLLLEPLPAAPEPQYAGCVVRLITSITLGLSLKVMYSECVSSGTATLFPQLMISA